MKLMIESIKKRHYYKILLLEDCYGMYNIKFPAGTLMEWGNHEVSESEDSYIFVAGHGQETVIPKSKAKKIKYWETITIEREEE